MPNSGPSRTSTGGTTGTKPSPPHQLDARSGPAPARPSPGRPAGRRTASRTPPPPSPSRSSRSRRPSSRWSRISNSNSGGSPTSRSVTASSSVSPSGASGSGRLGSVDEQLVALRLDLGELRLEPLDLGAHLAHLGDQRARRPRRSASPPRSRPRPGSAGPAAPRPRAAARAGAASRRKSSSRASAAPRRASAARAGSGSSRMLRRSSIIVSGRLPVASARLAVASPTANRSRRLDGRLGLRSPRTWRRTSRPRRPRGR